MALRKKSLSRSQRTPSPDTQVTTVASVNISTIRTILRNLKFRLSLVDHAQVMHAFNGTAQAITLNYDLQSVTFHLPEEAEYSMATLTVSLFKSMATAVSPKALPQPAESEPPFTPARAAVPFDFSKPAPPLDPECFPGVSFDPGVEQPEPEPQVEPARKFSGEFTPAVKETRKPPVNRYKPAPAVARMVRKASEEISAMPPLDERHAALLQLYGMLSAHRHELDWQQVQRLFQMAGLETMWM